MDIPQETAVKIMHGLIDEVESLKNDVAFSEAHTRWLTNALSATEQIFGRGSRIYLNLADLPWRETGSFIMNPRIHGTMDYNKIKEKFHHEAYLKQLDTAKGLLQAGIDDINLFGLESVFKPSDTKKEVGEIITMIALADTKLRKTIRVIPSSEREVQDKFEDLLIATDIKYLREQERIVYSSKTYQPDFSFPAMNTVLEIKLCDKKSREKEVISEINDDIAAYKTKYPNIVFLVYDVGHIRDVDQFKQDIQSQDGVIVIVVKH